MKPMFRIVLIIAWCSSVSIAAQHNARGKAAMGFDQDKTTHHFRLTTGGGVIQVAVNDASDHENLRLVRTHLKEIAAEFERGDFQKPFDTHNEVPPGVPQMQDLQAFIKYTFTQTANGALVRIASKLRN